MVEGKQGNFTMQVCDYCKTENADDHKFCKECGNRLKSLVSVEFENLDESEQLDIQGMKTKAFVYSTRGNFEQAVDELVRAIREHPPVAELHFQLGTVYYKNVRIENAINEFERRGFVFFHEGGGWPSLRWVFF